MSHANNSLTEQDSGWVSECAGRLRLIQADAAGVSADKRREYLHEEITRACKEVPPANRKRYLEVLLTRFPVAGQAVHSVSAPAAPPPVAPVVETADQILERLLAATAKLPEDKRADVSRRLSEAGLVWVDREALVLEVSEKLRQKIGLQNDQQPQLAKVVELLAFLVEALSLVDQNALKTMRELSPRSALLNRGEDFRKTAALYLTSEGASLDAQWNAIRGLLGSLLAAMQGGGKEFGKQFLNRMSPDAIEDVILSEGSKFMGPGKSERCWARYKELFEDYATPDLIDRKIKDSLAGFVERAMHSNR